MYNKGTKEKYINSGLSKSQINKCTAAFKKIVPFEEEKNKDIALFSTKEIDDMFERLESISEQTVYDYKSSLRKYINFVIKTRLLDVENNPIIVTRRKVKQKRQPQIKVFSKKDIYDLIESSSIPNYIDKMLILAYYENLLKINDHSSYDLLRNIKDSDLTSVEEVAKKYNVSEKLAELMIKTSQETQRSSLDNGKVRSVQSGDPFMLKSYETQKKEKKYGVSVNIIRLRTSRLFNALSERSPRYQGISAKDVNESGKVNWILEYATKKGLPPLVVLNDRDFKEAFQERYGDADRSYSLCYDMVNNYINRK